MELCLHQIRGRRRRWRCAPGDARSAKRPGPSASSQNEVRAMMPNPELFMPDTLENVQSYLERPLPWRMGRQAAGAYFILRYCRHSEHNYAAFIGIQAEWGTGPMPIASSSPAGGQWPAAAILAGRRAAAGFGSIVGIGATISSNPCSLNNAGQRLYEIIPAGRCQWAHDRYLLAKHL